MNQRIRLEISEHEAILIAWSIALARSVVDNKPGPGSHAKLYLLDSNAAYPGALVSAHQKFLKLADAMIAAHRSERDE